MSSNIQKILEELYQIEPTLREKESLIIPIIESMLQSKPKVQIDEAFRQELRSKILTEIRSIESKTQKTERKESIFPAWLFPAFGSAFAAVFVSVLAFQFMSPAGVSPLLSTSSNPTLVSFAPTIQKVGRQAFGSQLALQNQSQGAGAANPVAMSMKAEGAGDDAVMQASMASDSVDMKRMMMPIGGWTRYEYTYSGELTLPTEELTVYKKNPVAFAPGDTSSLLRGFRGEGFDVSKLQSASVTSISLAEDAQYGYTINIDFLGGGISLYQNNQWPQVTEPRTLTASDIPKSEDLIEKANAFLAKYGIDTSLYGKPKVDEASMIMYARAIQEGKEGYIPEMYTITYPLQIDGKDIYEEYGGYKGIVLNYDVRSGRISNLYGLEKQSLQSSLYAPVTDRSIIDQMIKAGGRYITPASMSETSMANTEEKVVQISLGSPTIEYVRVYGEWKDGKSDEYYIPAYVFPVLNKPTDSYINDRLIIPVVKDFVQIQNPLEVVDPIIYSTEDMLR